MIGFSILWLVLLILSLEKNNKYICWGVLFFLSIMMGYRGVEVGPDTGTYSFLFDWIREGGALHLEPLWRLVNYIVYILGGGFNEMLWVVSSIILFFIYISTKESPNRLFSIFVFYSIYYVFYSMNIMRQMVAVSIVMYGYTLFNKGYKWRFVFSVLMAMMFHSTGILGFAIFFLKKFKISMQRVCLLIFFSLFAGFLVNATLLGIVAGPYAGYLLKADFFRPSVVSVLALCVLLSSFYAYIFWTSTEEFRSSLWMKIFLVGVILNNAMFKLELGTRLVMFFSVVQILVLPLYFYNNIIKQKYLGIGVVILYLAGIFFVLLGIRSVDIYPYSNVLLDLLF